MFREIMNDLIKWKEKTRRKPLLVTGVRQCRKTYNIPLYMIWQIDYYK